jgi:hypothetical protein
MSWSVSAIGKPPAVIASLAKKFATNPCEGPEEYVRQDAWKSIASSLGAQDPNCVVKVNASGSAGFKDYFAKAGPYNNLSISIEPQTGFVE